MFDNLQHSHTYAQRVQRAFTSAQNPLCCRPLLLHLTHLGYVMSASDTTVFWSQVWQLWLWHLTLLCRDRPSNCNHSLWLFMVLLVGHPAFLSRYFLLLTTRSASQGHSPKPPSSCVITPPSHPWWPVIQQPSTWPHLHSMSTASKGKTHPKSLHQNLQQKHPHNAFFHCCSLLHLTTPPEFVKTSTAALSRGDVWLLKV